MLSVKKGITLIELLLVVAIMIVIAVSTASFGSAFLVRNRTDNKVNEVVSSLRTAQINAMSGKGNSQWGVYTTSTEIILFMGTSYASRDNTYDQTFFVPPSVSVSAAEVIFDTITGNPDATETISISNDIGESFSVNVNGVGIVDVE
jgi:type II secretory pathway pseudopilin PulG